MVRVTLSKEAQRDSVSIRDYIRDDLCNTDAAKRIIVCLKKSVQSLEKY
jgi:plasmid stabilization system protein ParE